VRARICQRSNH